MDYREDDGAKIVGVHGVGGIGKTTLCKMLCNEMSRKYEGRTCHVELESKGWSLMEVLHKVLTELTSFSVEGLGQLNEGQVSDARLVIKKFVVIDYCTNENRSHF